MTKDERIKALAGKLPDFSPDWPSSAVFPRTKDHIDAIEFAFWYGSRTPLPTPRQKTLSRLTGRPWEDFIP